ncbi:hypothetical protein GH741_11295 [Aquibacillus halophilus]|uniref:Uncharacterized protein n=1 Tax=Aquibacillus halophilus TaxID=930132 RepID=A0A6A8DC17_9BACI|nr:hypothetical protein [Aquibacillus halophilus]MRH43265.1 hypothetical protein [Aquibacillus halophilus]
MKSIISYFLYALLLFGTLLLVSYIDFRLEIIAKQDYRVWKWVTIKQFLYIPVGFALAFPYVVKNFKKDGNWKFDYKKIIFFGIPALCLTFSYTLYYHSVLGIVEIPWWIQMDGAVIELGGALLGYIIFSSFFKTEKD